MGTVYRADTADKSIFDINGRQAYLGNDFSAPLAGFSLTGTSETNALLLQCPSSATKSLFVHLRRLSSTAQPVQAKFYFNPTFVALGTETVVTKADSSGNLNNKYWTFYLPSGAGFYVWYNINSAGTDPAVAGLTGIQVAAATDAANTTIATNSMTAINSATAGTVASVTGHTITLTMAAPGPFTPAADSSGAATTFTFASTGGVGTSLTPVNCRPSSSNTSISTCSSSPITSASGTLVDTLETPSDFYLSTDSSRVLILDPGNSLLVTLTAQSANTSVNVNIGFYEIGF